MDPSGAPPTRWFAVYNADTQPAPPYALLAITGLDSSGRLTVTRPSSSSQSGLLVNGPVTIPPGQYGQAHSTFPATIAYQLTASNDSAPATGQTWGSLANTWQLASGQTGFLILGGSAKGYTTAMQAPTALGAAGGDLSGSYPNPTVVGLQARPVSSTAPSNGQVLTWNGSAWAPATPSSGVTSVTGTSPISVSPTTGTPVVSLPASNPNAVLYSPDGASNAGWTSQGGVYVAAAAYTIPTTAHLGTFAVNYNGATITLPPIGTVGAGFIVWLHNLDGVKGDTFTLQTASVSDDFYDSLTTTRAVGSHESIGLCSTVIGGSSYWVPIGGYGATTQSPVYPSASPTNLSTTAAAVAGLGFPLAAGNWRIRGRVRAKFHDTLTGGGVYCQLYNAGSPLSNTEYQVLFCNVASTDQEDTVTIDEPIILTSSSAGIAVYAWHVAAGTVTAAQVLSDSSGRSMLEAVRSA